MCCLRLLFKHGQSSETEREHRQPRVTCSSIFQQAMPKNENFTGIGEEATFWTYCSLQKELNFP